MKLSQYAKQRGCCYRTAWNHYNQGKIDCFRDETNHIVVKTKKEINNNKIAIYARVSSSENKDNLESQANRLVQYATTKGYQVVHIVKEIGSGVNDTRPKLLKLLKADDYGTILIEHKDRLTRFGFNYIETLLTDKTIEIVNMVEDGEQDIIQDFASIITSFCARIYGQRRSKRKTEKLIQQLKDEQDD